jgi:glyoxylase-like metal-dependent hydrolase (beta-lactamase superfamily II)
MREILDGMVMWSWASEPHGYDFNGYFIRHPEGNLCVDPVEPSEEVLAFLAREGVSRISSPTATTSAAPPWSAADGRTRAIHPADAAHARGQGALIDAELRVGERIGPFTVVGVPGKSPGEVAFHCPKRRLLIVGDAVIGNPPGRLSLLRAKIMDDPARLRAGVAALADLDLETILVGDGVPVLRDAGARLRELVATFPT